MPSKQEDLACLYAIEVYESTQKRTECKQLQPFPFISVAYCEPGIEFVTQKEERET
jgi:hypothetical protein